MDASSALSALASVIKYLYQLAEQAKQNKEECKRLATHADTLYRSLDSQSRPNMPEDLVKRIQRLSNVLSDLCDTLEGLEHQSYLKRLLWSPSISDRIKKANQCMQDAIQAFHLDNEIDIRRFQHEHQKAMAADAENTQSNFKKVQDNDQAILSLLEVHKAEMQEDMLGIYQYLSGEQNGPKRDLLQRGLHAMQRKSGKMRHTPNELMVTSLDVVVHHDRKLGSGGFAEVYECTWKGIRAAVKVLDKGISDTMLLQEMEVWRRLRHPHILEFYGAAPLSDPPFFLCALKMNGNALMFLQKNPQADRRKLLHDASLGLLYLHSHSIIHGDLKAANILIDENGQACLSDFGLSKIKMHTSTLRSFKPDLSQHGTARWMSPEQMLDGVTNNETDIYSFGMTMYEIYSGVPPFSNTADPLLLQLVVEWGRRPRRPDNEANELDDQTWQLMEAAWHADPKHRPSASEVVSRLLSENKVTRVVPVGLGYIPPKQIATPTARLQPTTASPSVIQRPAQTLTSPPEPLSFFDRLLAEARNDPDYTRARRSYTRQHPAQILTSLGPMTQPPGSMTTRVAARNNGTPIDNKDDNFDPDYTSNRSRPRPPAIWNEAPWESR